MPQGLPRKLRRVFAVQALLATLAVVACLYASSLATRGILASQWLRSEADRFWVEVALDPGHPPPRSTNARGYFLPEGAEPAAIGVPAEFLGAAPGLHRISGPGATRRLLVEDGPGGRLYLGVAFPVLDRLVMLSLLIASLLVAVAIGVVSWLSYRTARRMVLPVTAMAQQVSRWDPRAPDLDAIDPEGLPGKVGSEVRLLGGALRGLSDRTQSFMRRERDFTREASHELRTPLTVVRVATDMLGRDPDLPERLQRPLQRVQVATRDMEAVVNALLMLAREDEPGGEEEVDVLEVADEALAIGRALLVEQGRAESVALSLEQKATPGVRGSRRALLVILEQLVRNACTFTPEGRIDVVVDEDRVEVRDTGVGMERDVLERVFEPFYRADQYVGGRGLGLAVVRRLAARAGWVLHIESVPREGTTVVLQIRAVSAS